MTELTLPASPTEQTIADIWADGTGVSPVGRDDRFSDLGGTSLAAESALVELRNRLGRNVSAEFLSEDPTVAELAEAIEDAGRTDFRQGVSTCTHLTPGNEGKPVVFCFAGAGASSVSFLALARHLSDRFDVWSFHAHGFHSRGIADRSLAAKARRHLADIDRIRPAGPVTLLGHSFGGHVALEAARQLAHRGREVAQVLLLDTFLRATDGGSVADYHVDGRREVPPLHQRLLTHWRILTAGLVQRDVHTQQAVFWEQEIRIQNRIRHVVVPPHTTIFVSDQSVDQEPLWLALDNPPATVRVPGGHLDVLTDARTLNEVRRALSTPESA